MGYLNPAPPLAPMPTLRPTAASTADADRAALHTTASGVPNEHVSRLRHSFCSSSCSTTTTSSWRSNHHAGATSCTRSSNGGLHHAPARAMTMFNITDGKNNISRDKPVEHIDLVIGLHVSACTSCTRTMRFRRDMRSTSPSRCSCSSASRRFDRCPSCPSSSTTTSTRCA